MGISILGGQRTTRLSKLMALCIINDINKKLIDRGGRTKHDGKKSNDGYQVDQA
jgi:hypothetical protein